MIAPLDRVVTYVTVHPYYNQLWGTFALPFILAFGFLFLREPNREQRWILAVPHEPGWGLQALWFSFIAVDAFELDGRTVEVTIRP